MVFVWAWLVGRLWKVSEVAILAVGIVRRANPAAAVKWFSVMIAAGWVATLLLNPDSDYMKPVNTMIGPGRLLVYFGVLLLLQGASLFLTRRDRDDEGCGPASPERAGNHLPFFLLSLIGFSVGAALWLYMTVVVNLPLPSIAAAAAPAGQHRSLSPYTFLHLSLFVASAAYAVLDAVYFKSSRIVAAAIREQQQQNQQQQQQSAPVSATPA